MLRLRVLWAAVGLAAAGIAIPVAAHQSSHHCAVSGATGGGTPSLTVRVGAPVAQESRRVIQLAA